MRIRWSKCQTIKHNWIAIDTNFYHWQLFRGIPHRLKFVNYRTLSCFSMHYPKSVNSHFRITYLQFSSLLCYYAHLWISLFLFYIIVCAEDSTIKISILHFWEEDCRTNGMKAINVHKINNNISFLSRRSYVTLHMFSTYLVRLWIMWMPKCVVFIGGSRRQYVVDLWVRCGQDIRH